MAPRGAVETAAPLIPEAPSLDRLVDAAAVCKACDLWRSGTQTVFGDGPARARVMFVGEQPGDKEDLAGEPFVGPAGALLDSALDEVGIDRSHVYVTNVVKHFKWEARGKRRIHKKPNLAEIAACKPWLEAELDVVRPKVVVLLGATAAQALMGRDFRVTQRRGEVLSAEFAPKVVATVHPSSILRAGERREKEMEGFVSDLRVVAKEIS